MMFSFSSSLAIAGRFNRFGLPRPLDIAFGGRYGLLSRPGLIVGVASGCCEQNKDPNGEDGVRVLPDSSNLENRDENQIAQDI